MSWEHQPAEPRDVQAKAQQVEVKAKAVTDPINNRLSIRQRFTEIMQANGMAVD